MRDVAATVGNMNFRPWRGGGFKDATHRERFIAAGVCHRVLLTSRPRCTAIAKSTGQRCRCPTIGVKDVCRRHDRSWKPKDPTAPRWMRSRAIQAAKRYNRVVYKMVDAALAELPPMPPAEYDAMRQTMLRGRLWWVPPLQQWIDQGMPWPPEPIDKSATEALPAENQGQSQPDPLS